MRNREFRAVVDASSADTTTGWSYADGLYFRVPTEFVLTGLLSESSSFGKGAYLWSVAMPLYVPSEHMVLNWSERLGSGSTTFEPRSVELQNAIERFFDASPPPQSSLLSALKKHDGRDALIGELEVAGGAHLLLGGDRKARRCYTRILGHPDLHEEFAVRHYPNVQPRVEALLAALDTADGAVPMLEAECAANRQRLGLG